MNFLYHQFVDHIKKEQIRQYNIKHRDYLIRAGKLQTEEDARPMKTNRRQRQFQNPKPSKQITQKPSIQTKIQDQRPIKPISLNQQNLRSQENMNSITFGRKKQKQEKIKQHLPVIEKQDDYFMEEEVQPKQDNRPVGKGKQISQIQQYAQVKLIACPEGCGRSFKAEAIEKHAKACKKVFQEKRKKFEVKLTNQEAQQVKGKNGIKEREGGQKKSQKWKKDSQKFRLMLKQGKQGGLSKQEMELLDDRIQCPHCNRKFSENAATRHIEICKKKNGAQSFKK